MTKTREEHLAWAKKRALEYLDAGDLVNAVASMGSDLNKHEETRVADENNLMALGMMYVLQQDEAGVRRWIEGWR